MIDLGRRAGRVGLVLTLFGSLAMLTACVGGDSLTNPPTNDGKGDIVWTLNPKYRAINLAVGDKIQLEIDPLDADGNRVTLSELQPYRYEIFDTSAVQVDENGVLTAKQPRPFVPVIAVMQDLERFWTVRDTIAVRVVPTRYTAHGIQLQVLAFSPYVDLTKMIQPINETVQFIAYAVDASGTPVLDEFGSPIQPLVHMTSSVPRRDYLLNTFQGMAYGTPTSHLSKPVIRGSTYLFGDFYEDSVSLTVTYPMNVNLNIVPLDHALNPSPSVLPLKEVTILKGGTVTFVQTNSTSPGDDIVFDDLENVIDGNIQKLQGSFVRHVVTFPFTGEFTFKSNSMGVTGKVTVIDPPEL